MKKQILFSLLLVFTTPIYAYGDEVSETDTPETAVKDAQGRYQSPENQIGKDDDADSEKKPEPMAAPAPEGLVPVALLKLGMGEFYSKYAFILDKTKRTLYIWENTPQGLKLVESHPSDMGRNGGDKTVLGDKKTPEGVYFFLSGYNKHQLDFNEYGERAFTMDYPNLFDRRERKTGSGIWLHGIPDTKTLYRGSRGCVVVRNEIIKTLDKYITFDRTPIVVQQNIEWAKPNEWKQRQSEMLAFLNGWKKSWEEKNIDSYIDFYSEKFRSLRMDKDQWKEFKTGLNAKYEYIKVQIGKPSIYLHEDEGVIRFLQAYSSDVNSDFGEKTLHLKRDADGKYRIISERWKALSNKMLALLQQ